MSESHEHTEKDNCGSCSAHDHEHSESKIEVISISISAVLVGVGLVLEHLLKMSLDQVLYVYIASILIGGWFLVPKAWESIRRLTPDINLLMVIAVIGASFIKQWSEAAVIVVLFGVAEWLEGFSVRRARGAISSLLDLAPQMVRVKSNGQVNEVSVNNVSIDTIFEVKPGERISLDGVITSGQSSVNQAPITGESMPVEKKVGDNVFAGTLNGESVLEIKSTKAYNDSTLSRIIKLVEEAQEQRAPAQKFVDQFAKYYTPGILILSILVFLVPVLFFSGNTDQWLYRALVLLVISCPCALVIATPVSIVSGLTALANKGVLVKGGAYLELLGKMKALAVDKTGTVTLGTPSVHDVVTMSGKSVDEILWIAGSLDSNSNHPLAQAIVAYAKSKNINLSPVTNFKSITGKGGEGEVEGHPYFIGNHRLAHELGVCSSEVEAKLSEIESKALSVSIVGHKPHGSCKGEILGILAIGDMIRKESTEAFKEMYNIGIEKVVMLSGDNQRTASAIAKEAGIKEATGDLLPEQKVDKIKELKSQYEVVGMVGDGVNDAPALATASLGIAMGVAGSDTAIETADVALMKDDLRQISFAIHTGKRTLNVIKFNIAFALLTKAVFIVLATTGHTSLWLAIMADTGATLLVVVNSLRLLKS